MPWFCRCARSPLFSTLYLLFFLSLKGDILATVVYTVPVSVVFFRTGKRTCFMGSLYVSFFSYICSIFLHPTAHWKCTYCEDTNLPWRRESSVQSANLIILQKKITAYSGGIPISLPIFNCSCIFGSSVLDRTVGFCISNASLHWIQNVTSAKNFLISISSLSNYFTRSFDPLNYWWQLWHHCWILLFFLKKRLSWPFA